MGPLGACTVLVDETLCGLPEDASREMVAELSIKHVHRVRSFLGVDPSQNESMTCCPRIPYVDRPLAQRRLFFEIPSQNVADFQSPQPSLPRAQRLWSRATAAWQNRFAVWSGTGAVRGRFQHGTAQKRTMCSSRRMLQVV